MMKFLPRLFVSLAMLGVVLFSSAGALAQSPFGTDDEQAVQEKKNVQEVQKAPAKRSAIDILPPCAKTGDMSEGSQCRDVSIFIVVLINVARYLFSIIGALALLMFVYGGFMLIISSGSAERVKKGGQIMLAALVGLLIAFSAYMLVRFLGGAVGLETGFKLK